MLSGLAKLNVCSVCGNLPQALSLWLLMSKSLRVSDALFVAAQNAGTDMTRSTAQQVEHWARLGQTLEAGGITVSQAIALLKGNLETVVSEEAMWQDKRRRQATDRELVRTGALTADHLNWFRSGAARNAKVVNGPL